MKAIFSLSIMTLASFAIGMACSNDAQVAGNTGGGGTMGSGGESTVSPPRGGNSGASIILGTSAVVPRDAGGEETSMCKTEQVVTTMVPTRLAFAFDVSGSMGEGDEKWHDKSLKWDPVVAATKGFFADRNSQGIEASLVFFPMGNDTAKCLASTYATPNVPMTTLPSNLFAEAIDRQAPDGDGTPSVAVIEGTLSYIRAQRAAKPGKYVLVLATDGYPGLCGSGNSIANAASAVAAARTDGIPTYVIGVRNPPITGAPDVTSNLSQIATAGGTAVFFLDTGTPSATQQALAKAINEIRGATITCDIKIPEPPAGRTFDKKKVILTYTSGTGSPLVLTYDAACAVPNSWHYDDPNLPTRVLLCPSICSTVQADTKAALNVGFACEEVITVIQ